MKKPVSYIIARGSNCNDLYKQLDDKGNISINSSLIDKLIHEGVLDLQMQLEDAIKVKLSEHGFDFKNRQEFLNFAQARLTKVQGLDHKGTSWLYLDMNTPDEKPICSFIDEYSTKEVDGKITMTWGQRIIS